LKGTQRVPMCIEKKDILKGTQRVPMCIEKKDILKGTQRVPMFIVIEKIIHFLRYFYQTKRAKIHDEEYSYILIVIFFILSMKYI